MIILAILSFVLICMAGFRPMGIDKDSFSYLSLFDKPEGFLEPTFLTISAIVHFFSDDARGLFVVYAVIGVVIKFMGIMKLTNLLFLSVMMYISNFFMLHEMTQIRIGVAAGFFLIMLYLIYEGERLKASGALLVAILFHYSAFMLLPILFMRTGVFHKTERIICFVALPIAYLLYFKGLDLFVSIPIPYIQQKMLAYQKVMKMGMGDTVNVFGLLFLVKVAIYYLLLIKEKLLAEHDGRVYMLLRIECASLVSLVLFSSFPVAAFRMNELYGVVEIVLFPVLFYLIKPEWVSRLTVITVGMTIFFINIFLQEYIS